MRYDSDKSTLHNVLKQDEPEVYVTSSKMPCSQLTNQPQPMLMRREHRSMHRYIQSKEPTPNNVTTRLLQAI
jgi:hypothetical protein